MKLPSKELLSEVLGVFEVIDIEEDYNELIIEYFETQDDVELNEDGVGGSTDKTINIYELAHKCKEWVKKKEYWAISGYDEGYFCMLHDMPDNRFFNASTEIEAIFKACEWIMEQIKCGS